MREQYCYSTWTVLLQCINSNFCLCTVNLLFMHWRKKKGQKRGNENVNVGFSWTKRSLRVRLGSAFCASQTHVYVSEFFFFFWSSCNFLTFPVWTMLLCTVHGSHKIQFSATFSLKMGLTILFTHLKIILLQCFSVFSFSFQFSAVSKRTLILI